LKTTQLFEHIFLSIEDIQIQKASITCRVFQGSNLGPLHFLVYVNDITHISKFKSTLFAVLFQQDWPFI